MHFRLLLEERNGFAIFIIWVEFLVKYLKVFWIVALVFYTSVLTYASSTTPFALLDRMHHEKIRSLGIAKIDLPRIKAELLRRKIR
jgi:hypothetical protein